MTKSRYLRRREAITLDPLPAEDGRVLVKASRTRLSFQRLDWTSAAASIAARSRTQEEGNDGPEVLRVQSLLPWSAVTRSMSESSADGACIAAHGLSPSMKNN
jgi:hypothetical protein